MADPSILIPRDEDLSKAEAWPPKGKGWKLIQVKRGGRPGMYRDRPGKPREYVYQPKAATPPPKRPKPVQRPLGGQMSLFGGVVDVPEPKKVAKVRKTQGKVAAKTEVIRQGGKLKKGATLNPGKQQKITTLVEKPKRNPPGKPGKTPPPPVKQEKIKRKVADASRSAKPRVGWGLFDARSLEDAAAETRARTRAKVTTTPAKTPPYSRTGSSKTKVRKPPKTKKERIISPGMDLDALVAELADTMGKDGSTYGFKRTMRTMQSERAGSWIRKLVRAYGEKYGKSADFRGFLKAVKAAEERVSVRNDCTLEIRLLADRWKKKPPKTGAVDVKVEIVNGDLTETVTSEEDKQTAARNAKKRKKPVKDPKYRNRATSPDLDEALANFPWGVQGVLYGLQSKDAARWLRKVAAQHFEHYRDLPKLVDFLQHAADVERYYQQPKRRELDELVTVDGAAFIKEDAVTDYGRQLPVYVAERREPVLAVIQDMLNEYTKGEERVRRLGDVVKLPDGRTGEIIGWAAKDLRERPKEQASGFFGQTLTHAVVKVAGDPAAVAVERAALKTGDPKAAPAQTPILMSDVARLAKTAEAEVSKLKSEPSAEGDATLTKAYNNGLVWALEKVATLDNERKTPDVKLGYSISEAEARIYGLRDLAMAKSEQAGELQKPHKDAFWQGVHAAMGVIWKTADQVRGGVKPLADVAYDAGESDLARDSDRGGAGDESKPFATQLAELLPNVGDYGGRPGWAAAKRKAANARAVEVLRSGAVVSDDDREALKAYSGRGGIAKDGFGALNEYYTPPKLAATVWKLVQKAGFKGGDVFEPTCGTGVFMEHKPADASVVGVELDRLSGGIARALHQENDNEVVVGKALEEFAITDVRQFAAAVGNPPFGSRGGHGKHDPEKSGLTAEQYGLDTSIDKLNDYGLCAMVVPLSIMTGQGPQQVAFRERLARKAEVLGAYRLPSGTFGNSGTGVPTDLVLFRRKPHDFVAASQYATPDELTDAAKHQSQGEMGEWPTDFIAGRYFEKNPKHVIGTQRASEYGARIEVDGELTDEALVGIVDGFKLPPIGGYDLPNLYSSIEDNERKLKARAASQSQRPYQAPIGQTRVVDGVTRVLREVAPGQLEWIRVDDESELRGLGEGDKEALAKAREIGIGVNALQALIRTEPDARKVDSYRRELRDKVVHWREEYGLPKANGKVTEKLAELRIACAFAACVNPDGEVCDLLRYQIAAPKQTDPDPTEFPTVAAAADYLARKHNGVIVPDEVARLMGTNDAAAAQRAMLKSDNYFLDDDGQFVDRARFLSGYLYEKLDTIGLGMTLAKAAAKDAKKGGIKALFSKAADKLSEGAGPADETRAATKRRLSFYGKQGLLDDASLIASKLEAQVAMLHEALAPSTTTFEEISVGPNDGWVPHDMLAQFWQMHMGGLEAGHTLRYTGARYVVESDGVRVDQDDNWPPRGGETMKAFLNLLNRENLGKNMKVLMYGVEDRFRAWLAEDDTRRQAIEDSYNRTFHSYRARTASQDALELKDWDHGVWEVDERTGKRRHVSGGWSPHGYQYQVARWALELGRGILGDDVGLGKTTEVIAMISALQAEGGARKPIVCVPKALMRNWEKEILDLRPGAKIKIIGEKLDRNGNPKSQTGKEKAAAWQDVAVNQYDFVICSRESFGMLRLGEDRAEQYYDSEYDNRNAAVKDNEKYAKGRTKFLSSMKDAEAKKAKNGAPLLEDIGIDALFLDEGHAYKNLYAAKQRRGEKIKYLGASRSSKRAVDMAWKAKAIRELNQGRGVYIATATPVKNSPLEVYNMMSLIAPEVFEDRGIRNVEEFIKRYCAMEERQTFNAKGEVVTEKCVVGFQNLRELRNIIGQYMVVRDANTVGLEIPTEVTEGHIVDMSEAQEAVYDGLRQAMNAMRETGKGGEEITTTEAEDGSDEALEEGKKKKPKKRAAKTTKEIMNAVAEGKNLGKDHMFRILHAMQVVSTDPMMAAEIMAEDGYRTAEELRSPKLEQLAKSVVERMNLAREKGQGGGQIIFSDLMNKIHGRIVDHLVAEGIPRDRIGIINRQECPTAAAQQAVAKAFQEGDLDVVIGNTSCMGEGVNLQKKSTDMHHLDVPWDPGSLQQRRGRMTRQGNPESEVTQHYYGARGTFDFYKQSTMQGKANWIHDLWNGTGDGLRIPPESQGFTEEDMIIFGSADPEKAVQEVEERKRLLELKQADKSVKAAMKLYADLRRAHNEAKRMEAKKAEGGKINERMLIAKRNFADRARSKLQDDIFFPEKSALTDDALEKAVIVPATGLAVVPGMTLTWLDENKVTRYFVVHEVEQKDSGVRVTGREIGAGAGGKSVLLSGHELDKCEASGLTLVDAVPMMISAIEEVGPDLIHKLSQAEIDANESEIQAALLKWAAATHKDRFKHLYGWVPDDPKQHHVGDPELILTNVRASDLAERGFDKHPERLFVGSTRQVDKMKSLRREMEASAAEHKAQFPSEAYGAGRWYYALTNAKEALIVTRGKTEAARADFEIITPDRDDYPDFASWALAAARLRFGERYNKVHSGYLASFARDLEANTRDGKVETPAGANASFRAALGYYEIEYTIGLLRDLRAGKITIDEVRDKAPPAGFNRVVSRIIFGDSGGVLPYTAQDVKSTYWREPFLSIPGVRDDGTVAALLAMRQEGERVVEQIETKNKARDLARQLRGGDQKAAALPKFKTKLWTFKNEKIEVELVDVRKKPGQSPGDPPQFVARISHKQRGATPERKFPLSRSGGYVTLDAEDLGMTQEDLREIAGKRREWEAQISVEAAKAKKSAKAVGLTVGAFSILEEWGEEGLIDSGSWRQLPKRRSLEVREQTYGGGSFFKAWFVDSQVTEHVTIGYYPNSREIERPRQEEGPTEFGKRLREAGCWWSDQYDNWSFGKNKGVTPKQQAAFFSKLAKEYKKDLQIAAKLLEMGVDTGFLSKEDFAKSTDPLRAMGGPAIVIGLT